MTDITLTTSGNTLTVVTPFDPSMPTRAKKIGGRWNPAQRAWTFDSRDEQRVRDLLRDIYGTDGSTDTGPAVTVRLECGAYNRQEFRIAGRRLAWRPARDADVVLADGVVIVSGSFPCSGGSVRNPRLDHDDPVVLEVRDVPAEQARKMCEQDVTAQIIDAAEDRRAALAAERDRLLARLAEIDTELAELA